MLWWEMMEARGEFKRVNELTQVTDSAKTAADITVAALSDSSITHIEQLESVLFASVGLVDKRSDAQLDPGTDEYYDQSLLSDTLIGKEPGRPTQHKNSAEALRVFLDGHKRAVEQVAGMTPGELDMFLFTGIDLIDYSGTVNHWANVHFYHVPLATAIERLTRMKIAVRLMQHHATEHYQITERTDSL